MATVALVVFWSAAGLIFYTYLGFPLASVLHGVLFRKPVRTRPYAPSVTFCIAAYNEADCMQAKLRNLEALEYPAGKWNAIVISDGSTDGTARIVENYGNPRIRVIEQNRSGKNAALNTAVAQASGEIVVFTDADIMLRPDTLRNMLAPLSDPTVVDVGGDLHNVNSGNGNDVERAYWN